MTDQIYLQGSEQVVRASHTFAEAVREFSMAASSLAEDLRRDRQERWEFLEAVKAARAEGRVQ